MGPASGWYFIDSVIVLMRVMNDSAKPVAMHGTARFQGRAAAGLT